MSIEHVFTGRSNEIVLALSANNRLIVHTDITRYQIKIGGVTLDSDISPQFFDRSSAKQVTMKFGGAGLSLGRYNAMLYVFDSIHTDGIAWGSIEVVIK